MGYDEEADVWNPVADEGERRRLLGELAAASAEMTLEGRDASAIFTAAVADPAGLTARMKADGPIPFRPSEELTAKFQHRGEIYFFRAVPKFAGAAATFETPQQLFQLQRRKAYRMPVPPGFPARIEVDVRRAGATPVRGSVVNIHAFGLAFEASKDEKFEDGELLETEVQLGERKAVRVAGHVRHTSLKGDKIQIGVQFDHSVLKSQDAVQAILGFFRHDSFYFNKKKS